MVSKVRNFWLCVFSGVVATTLIGIVEFSVDLGVKEKKERYLTGDALNAGCYKRIRQ